MLVSSRKDSRWVYYHLTDSTIRDPDISKIIDLTIYLLSQDSIILNDTEKTSDIGRESLEIICKRQQNM